MRPRRLHGLGPASGRCAWTVHVALDRLDAQHPQARRLAPGASIALGRPQSTMLSFGLVAVLLCWRAGSGFGTPKDLLTALTGARAHHSGLRGAIFALVVLPRALERTTGAAGRG